MKPVTLEEYQSAGEEFFPKYWHGGKEIGEGAKTEDILKVMEALSGVALRKRAEDEKTTIGF